MSNYKQYNNNSNVH